MSNLHKQKKYFAFYFVKSKKSCNFAVDKSAIMHKLYICTIIRIKGGLFDRFSRFLL